MVPAYLSLRNLRNVLIDLKLTKNGMCKRCSKEKNSIKMFSAENNMDPKEVPTELQHLSMVEQQPANIFPRLPVEVNIIKVRKQGKNNTSKDFRFRRYRVQAAKFGLASTKQSSIFRYLYKSREITNVTARW